MKKLIIIIISSFCILFSVGWYNRAFFSEKMYIYALEQAQLKYGHAQLSQEREAMIRSIAQEMGITEQPLIRKMNHNAMREFGYCNAFVFFYTVLNCIPLCNTPFLFVSEGFFEDLSVEEQRFLIGHELVHAQEHHTQYLNLALIGYFIIFLTLLGFGRSFMSSPVKYLQVKYGKFITELITKVPILIIVYIPVLTSLAYRRHIERVADTRCLVKLKEYDGACKLIDRWHKDFKVPLYNPYYGIFATHPSCNERKEYCLLLKDSEGRS